MAHTAPDNRESRWPVFRSLRSLRASDLPGDLIAKIRPEAWIAIYEKSRSARPKA